MDLYIVYFDGLGISSTLGTKNNDDYDKMLTEHIPYHIWPDVDQARKWEFIKDRKSLQRLESFFYNFCISVNKLLRKIEVLKHRIKNKN